MIKLHHYHQEKFSSFSEEKQLKAMLELLSALELNIADQNFRQAILPSILDCFRWSNPSVQNQLRPLAEINEDASAHEILHAIVPLIRLHKKNLNEYESEIYRFDGTFQQPALKPPFPLIVILDNLRSAYNVGSIFRSAECVGAAKLCLCGITPIPPHAKVLKTSMGTEDRVVWSYYTHTEKAVMDMKQKGMPVVALETAKNAFPLFDFRAERPVAVILGNEALGIEDKIIKLADEVLSIPVYGWKNSLNVSNAFTLAAYWLSGIIS